MNKKDLELFLSIIEQLEKTQEVEISMTDGTVHTIRSYDELRCLIIESLYYVEPLTRTRPCEMRIFKLSVVNCISS